MKTKSITSAILVIFVMATLFTSCSTSSKVTTTMAGHNILTRELMDNPSFNNSETLGKIQWLTSSQRIIFVRSYPTTVDTVIDGKFVTSVINIDTIKIDPFTKGKLIEELDGTMEVAFEYDSLTLPFTAPVSDKNGKYGVYSNTQGEIEYGEYTWKMISGGNGEAFLLFDLIKSKENKTVRVAPGISVDPAEEIAEE